MKFEYPNVLYAFFLLIIPIIIHLFNFRKYKTIYFSSLIFVKQVNEETKSTQKLKHLLVLISRLLAFSCIILAFAQPYFPIKNIHKSGNPLIAIYVDNSFSMSQKGTDGELLSMAKEKAKELVEKTEKDSKILIITNNFEAFEQRIVSKQNALERIDKIDYSPFKKEINTVLKWIFEAITIEKQEYQISHEQIILLTDFQKNNLNKMDKTMSNNSIIYPIQLVPQINSNVSIDSIWFENPNFKVGVTNEISIKLKNYGSENVPGIELELNINEIKRTVFVDLNAKSEEVVKINYADNKPGLKNGKISINDKQMMFDDDFFFSYFVNYKSSVLIIDGEDAVPNINAVYSLDPYYLVQNIKQNSFTLESIQEKDLIILNGWNEFSSASISLLSDYTKNGGSIGVFPGSKVEFNSYNSFFNKINLPKFNTLQSSKLKIKRLIFEDPFFKEMFEKKPKDLNLPTQNKIYNINKQNGNYLNLIELENNSPIFYKSLGENNVYVFASSLKTEFGNFNSNAIFSSILLRIAELSQQKTPLYISIGKEINFPVQTKYTVEKPIKLKSENLEFVPQTIKNNNKTYISIQAGLLQANFKAGLFDILQENKIGSVAINYDRIESDINHAIKDEIETYFENSGFQNVFYSNFTSNSNASIVKIDKPMEYWRIFIIFAIIFLILELALLKWLK